MIYCHHQITHTLSSILASRKPAAAARNTHRHRHTHTPVDYTETFTRTHPCTYRVAAPKYGEWGNILEVSSHGNWQPSWILTTYN